MNFLYNQKQICTFFKQLEVKRHFLKIYIHNIAGTYAVNEIPGKYILNTCTVSNKDFYCISKLNKIKYEF